MDLSILIVTYNSQDVILQCLESIFKSVTNRKLEVIVVDNNSKDGTTTTILNKYPTMKLVKNSYNYGFSHAMNQAYTLSTGRYVMLFNPDAHLQNHAVENLVGFMDNNPTIGLTGPVEIVDGVPQYSRHLFPYFKTSIIYRYLNPRKTPPAVPDKIDYIEGTALVIRRKALYDAPETLLLSDSFLFWEELILAQRIKKNGYGLQYCVYYQISHLTSTSFKHDLQKLYYARRLSLVIENKIRMEQYGILNSIINNFISAIENHLFSIIMRLKNGKCNNDRQQNEYQMLAKLHARYMYTSFRKVAEINHETRLFFNGLL